MFHQQAQEGSGAMFISTDVLSSDFALHANNTVPLKFTTLPRQHLAVRLLVFVYRT